MKTNLVVFNHGQVTMTKPQLFRSTPMECLGASMHLTCISPTAKQLFRGTRASTQDIPPIKKLPCSHKNSRKHFGLAIHQNDHQVRRRYVEWAQNEIAIVLDFHKRILFSDEVHFWLNGYVNKQNCRIWSEANPQVYVETPLHPEKLTVWCALWAGGILLQNR
ncbi:hypothetical protein TNCV_1525461 [Trichonephila clavipes]|nr:hypothetical protein TNCV_1525461 [Trichonephila clavipes]